MREAFWVFLGAAITWSIMFGPAIAKERRARRQEKDA